MLAAGIAEARRAWSTRRASRSDGWGFDQGSRKVLRFRKKKDDLPPRAVGRRFAPSRWRSARVRAGGLAAPAGVGGRRRGAAPALPDSVPSGAGARALPGADRGSARRAAGAPAGRL